MTAESENRSDALYGAYYFAHGCGLPYRRDEPHWERFFGAIADQIVSEIQPATVVDAGCAMGFLVEALRDRGVEAYGFDVSEYAIQQVRDDIARFCWVGSVTEPLPQRYDLIVCMEILEHVSAEDAELAIRYFSENSDDVLFSSSPLDFKEATHINVRPPEEWAAAFFRHGFVNDVEFDASFVTPWARRFRKSREPVGRLIRSYERRLWHLQQENQASRDLVIEQRTELASLEGARQDLAAAQAAQHRLSEAAAAILAGEPRASAGRKRSRRVEVPLPLTAVREERMINSVAGNHSLWWFRDSGSSITLHADLSPGRYVVRATTLASAQAELLVLLGQNRLTLQPVDRRIHAAAAEVEIRAPLDEFTIELAGPPGSVAILANPEVARRERRPLRLGLAHRDFRTAGARLREVTGRHAASKSIVATQADYERWLLDRLRTRASLFHTRPESRLFSIITTVWNTPVEYLEVLSASLFGQSDFKDFEWVLLDNGSNSTETRQYLKSLGQDTRVQYFRAEENRGIIGGMRFCLEQATGRYIVPVDSDDYLMPDCLRIIASHIHDNNYPALLYSDEDKLENGRPMNPYLKPDWDPVLFVNSCYTAHLCAIDRERSLELGAYTDPLAEGSHDWDSFMRFFLAGEEPFHVPEIVYSWRMHPGSAALTIDSKPWVAASHQAVLQKFLDARADARRYTVEPSPLFPSTPDWRFRRTRESIRQVVSFVLGNEAQAADIEELQRATTLRGHRIVAVPVDATLADVRHVLDSEARDDCLIHFVAEGVQIESDEWPWEATMLMELHPDVAMVGGRVYDVHDAIVAAGEYFGFGGPCGCPDIGRSIDDPGYFGQMWKQRSVSAVSTMFAVADADFVRGLLDIHESASLRYLGAWAGALAYRTGRRIVYSPFLVGRASFARRRWDDLIAASERAAFVAANRDLIPDTRFLSRWLSLDPATPYVPAYPADREQILRQAVEWRERNAVAP